MTPSIWYVGCDPAHTADVALLVSRSESCRANVNVRKIIPTDAHMKTDVVENLSTTHAAVRTPTDWPRNRKQENSDIAVPRVLGAICVACVCKEL